jgi:hypothetical protein
VARRGEGLGASGGILSRTYAANEEVDLFYRKFWDGSLHDSDFTFVHQPTTSHHIMKTQC